MNPPEIKRLDPHTESWKISLLNSEDQIFKENELYKSINFISSDCDNEDDKPEIYTLFEAINDSLKKHNFPHFGQIHTGQVQDPEILLAEIYFPDRIDANSKSILMYKGIKIIPEEFDELCRIYYDLISDLKTKNNWVLSSVQKWYELSHFYYTYITHDVKTQEINDCSHGVYAKKEKINTENTQLVASSNIDTDKIEKFLQDYSSDLHSQYFNKFSHTYFLFIPISLGKFPKKEHPRNIIGGCFLHFGFSAPIANHEAMFLDIYKDINSLANYYYTSEAFALRYKEIEYQTTRSAISQVMARNGSHNIGSHVMNKLVRGLVHKDFNIRNYQESLFDLQYHHEKEKDCFDKNNKPISRCINLTLAQIECFNAYIKNRMEYLGDMAINTPMMSSSKYLLNDIFKDFDVVRFLLDNISGLDNSFKFNFRFIINGTEATKENLSEVDIKLSIANDVTGCQAFYNILENIIRNTAKYSSYSGSDIITFTIELTSSVVHNDIITSEYYQINIYDNIEKPDIDELVIQQNNILNKDVISEVTKNLRQTSLGMIEMDASAAYLRMIEIADINKTEYDITYNASNNFYSTKGKHLPILNANKFKKTFDSKEHRCLGYQFYIAKPKEFLFVFDTECDIKSDKDKGIDVLHVDDFIKNLKLKKTFPHQFVLTNFEFNTNINKYKAQYSPRVLLIEKTLFNSKWVDETFEFKTWIRWTEFNLGTNKYYSLCADSPGEDNSNIVFSDHKLDLASMKLNDINDKKLITYESLSSLGQSKLPFFTKWSKMGLNDPLKNYISFINGDVNRSMIKDILGEAAQNKIFVLDERIQQFSREKYTFKQVSVYHYTLYQAMNVFMPSLKNTTDLNTEPYDIDYSEDSIFQTFDYNLSNKELDENLITNVDIMLDRLKPTFFVIHYGILERVYGKQKDVKIPELLFNWANKFFNMEIIITSGRTRLEGLPTNIRFINLGPLLTAFIDIRTKYVINKILNDSRI